MLLYAPANTQQECCALQDDLHKISNWVNRWKLNLKLKNVKHCPSQKKCKLVKFGYYINGQLILWNNPAKYVPWFTC